MTALRDGETVTVDGASGTVRHRPKAPALTPDRDAASLS